VDTTGRGGHLTADVEGLAIYDAGASAGYLIASSQGSSSYVVYRRGGDNAYVATFQIVAGGLIDAVSETDGIDVTSVSLGSAFPKGMFVAQDGKNDGCNQNFKLVSWSVIEAAIAQAALGPPGPAHTAVRVELGPRRDQTATRATSPSNKAFFPIISVGC
jgi:myo-inositol-hexaphosphate 3-phosphohydrolase